jgi:hypothetical protein
MKFVTNLQVIFHVISSHLHVIDNYCTDLFNVPFSIYGEGCTDCSALVKLGHSEAKHCHHVVQIVCDEFQYLLHLQTTKLNNCTLLFLGACGKQRDHINTAGGARQLNSHGQIHQYNKKVRCLWIFAHLAMGRCGYFWTYPHIFLTM